MSKAAMVVIGSSAVVVCGFAVSKPIGVALAFWKVAGLVGFAAGSKDHV